MGAHSITPASPYWKYAKKFAGRDPVGEADTAFAKDHCAIYSATGHALYYPGLDYGLGRMLAGEFGAMTLPGFSRSPAGRNQLT